VSFSIGQVVALKSARPEDARFTVLTARPSVPEGEVLEAGGRAIKGPAPATYECAMMSKNGDGVVSFVLPEHALCAAAVEVAS
jgi:hypothetical protein